MRLKETAHPNLRRRIDMFSEDEKRFWKAYHWYLGTFKFTWTGLILGIGTGMAGAGIILTIVMWSTP